MKIIKILNSSVNDPIKYFTRGHCYNFSNALLIAFPEGVPYYDSVEGHIYTKIGNGYYDATGLVKKIPSRMCNVKDISKPHRWSVRLDRHTEYNGIVKPEYVSVVASRVDKELSKLAKSLKQHNPGRRDAILKTIDVVNSDRIVSNTLDPVSLCNLISRKISCVVKKVDNITIIFGIVKKSSRVCEMRLHNAKTMMYLDGLRLRDIKLAFPESV